MEVNEFRVLGEKVSNGTASQEEMLTFLQEMNTTLEGMDQFLSPESESSH